MSRICPSREQQAALFPSRFIAVLAIFLLLAGQAVSTAQQSAPPQAPSAASQPPLKVTTRLVQMSVIATDKKGEPVTDLTRDDFVLTDEGSPQKIQLFSHQTNHPPATPPPALPPGTYTNQFLQRGETAPSVTVVLLDGLNTETSDQSYARQQTIKFLKRIQPQDRVAIYTLGHDLRVLQDFTADSSALVAALSKYSGQKTMDLDASTPTQFQTGGDAIMDAVLADAFQREANYYIQNRVQITCGALVDIADHLSTLPGRKNLLWVSGSFPFTVQFENIQSAQNGSGAGTATMTEQSLPGQQLQFQEYVEQAAEALDNADVAVYPVDARGLLGTSLKFDQNTNTAGLGASRGVGRGGLPGTATGAAARAANPSNASNRTDPANPIQVPDKTNLETMDQLALRTGGKPFYNTNDLLASLHDAIDDSRFTYEIGYYPVGVQWDGSFHNVSVRVNRPGVEVRARAGYFAVLSSAPTPDALKNMIRASVLSPLEATAMGLAVRIAPPGSDPHSLNAMLFFDPRSISFETNAGNYSGTIELAFAQLDDKRQVLDATIRTIPMNLSPQQFAQFTKQQVELTQAIPILPNAKLLRIVLCDGSTGKLGSVTVPLAQPAAPQQTPSQPPATQHP